MSVHALVRGLLLGALYLLAAFSPALAVTQDDLLEPEQAFRISTRALDAEAIEVAFRIADGYYMYRDRFKFETTSGKLLADVELPTGVKKTDAFFGETETYRREVRIRVPVDTEDRRRGTVKLKVTSQGCADVGVCYTPLEQMVQVRLPATPSNARTPLAPLRGWSLEPWAQALLGAAGLALFTLALQLAPALRGWRTRARATRWFYPALSLAVAALIVLSAYPLLPQQVRDLAWGSLLVVAAMWLRAIDPLPHDAGAAARVAKGLGVLALAAGVILLVFALGGRALLAPARAPESAVALEAPRFERVADLRALEARIRAAAQPTMLDFYADWCVTCKEMERFTFSDPAVRERMLKMQLLQVDVTRNTESDKALLQRFGVFGPPAILFFDTAGNELRHLRVIGYQSAERFAPALDRVLQTSREGRAR